MVRAREIRGLHKEAIQELPDEPIYVTSGNKNDRFR